MNKNIIEINDFIIEGADYCIFDDKTKISVNLFHEGENLRYLINRFDCKYTFEIKLNITLEEVKRMMPGIISIVMLNEIELYDGLITSEITGSPIEIMTIKENLVRIIFSDQNSLLPKDPECQKEYSKQYE